MRVRDLPTQYGRLGYSLRREAADACHVSLSGTLAIPPGGLLVLPPLPRPLLGVAIDGRESTDFGPDWVRCHTCPAELRLRY